MYILCMKICTLVYIYIYICIQMYADNFEREGYTELDFIASMKMAVSLSLYVHMS